MYRSLLALSTVCGWATLCGAAAAEEKPQAARPTAVRMVVMDPLAKELSCPCVQGYAQRDYVQLGKYLEAKLGVPVDVAFSESLVKALKDDERAEIVIGKRSVVEHDAGRVKRGFSYSASLTGKDGKTTQYGMIVVRTADGAKSAADLKGYRIYFGPEESDEKHAAAIALLKAHGVAPPAKLETVAGCEEGATAILEMGPEEKGAAVISSYAHPLLEGCGTVPKGAIRVVAETKPVPFVTAFVSDKVAADRRALITAALLEIHIRPDLMLALETKRGFVADDQVAEGKPAANGVRATAGTVLTTAEAAPSTAEAVPATASTEAKKK
jgi:ABC-type phosphate/phosphonate transport system substrate-binding protein